MSADPPVRRGRPVPGQPPVRPEAGGAPEEDAAAAAGPGAGAAAPTGPDLARAMLEQARAAHRRTPTDEERLAAAARRRELRRDRKRRPGGDPVPFAAAIEALLAVRGWEADLKTHEVVVRWTEIAGPEIAARCRPAGLRDGELLLVAESTAWATQLRLMSRDIRNRIDAELGPGVVTALRVHGPSGARQGAGGWRVAGGRGPRDTYG